MTADDAPQRPSRAAFTGAIFLVSLTLVPMLAGFVWGAERNAAADRDRYGSTVVTRLSAAAAQPLLDGDRIALSVLVREFSTLDGIATAAVYGADNRLLAAADGIDMSPAEFGGDVRREVYAEQITLQDSIAGYARIALDAPRFAPDHFPIIAFGIALGCLVLAAAWYGPPALQRSVAVVRDRQPRAVPAPPPGADPEATHPTERPLYIVVVNLFNQISLSAEERAEVIAECEALLERVSRLYGGRRERLPGTGLALVLDAVADEGDHAFQAICAALLAARVFEALNIDRSREGRTPLALRVGVARVGDEERVSALEASALTEACPDAVAVAVTLSALARDRAVVISERVHAGCDAASRLVAETLESPALRAAEDSPRAWLVHDLAEGYRGLLDRQAQLLLGMG